MEKVKIEPSGFILSAAHTPGRTPANILIGWAVGRQIASSDSLFDTCHVKNKITILICICKLRWRGSNLSDYSSSGRCAGHSSTDVTWCLQVWPVENWYTFRIPTYLSAS